MKCIKCNYNWIARIANPKSCPRCKVRFDYYNRDFKTAVQEIKTELNIGGR